MKEQDIQTTKKQSYLMYSRRSLRVNKKSYIVLFISIICMVMMSSNLIIYNSSYSNGENETIRRQYGDYYAKFYGLGMANSNAVNMLGYVKNSTDISYITTLNNPNEASSVSSVKMAVYEGEMKNLYFNITEGKLPGINEIIINEKTARAFNIYPGDTVSYAVNHTDKINDEMTFTVSGMFDGAECLDRYLFISEETVLEMLQGKSKSDYYAVDKYITFTSTFNGLVDRYTSSVIQYLGLTEEGKTPSSTVRENYQNTYITEMKQFYQKPSFLITVLLSVIPAAIAILVFITLDIFKNLKELSILSMIGTTPKQFFKMLFLKYFYIYIIAFPCGLLLSSALIGLLCAICSNMNYNEQIYLKFNISPLSVLILFFMCLSILYGLTYYISKKTTSGTYTEMLSGANNANNIFVRRTSGTLLMPGKRDKKLSILFFVRNRNVNMLFCAVIAVLMAVMAYFSTVLAQSIGNMPVNVDRGDYSITGDPVRDKSSTTISDAAIEEISGISGVERVITSFSEYSSYSGARPSTYIRQNKILSKPKTDLVGTLQKYGTIRAGISCEEYDQAEVLYGQYVVSGDLSSLYDGSQSVAVFVHTWANNSSYYRAGDQIEIKPAYEIDDRTGKITEYTTFRVYTIGAVLYDRFDEYENVSIVRFLTGPELYTELTGIESPTRLDITLTDNSESGMSASLSGIREVCRKYNLQYTNERTLFLQRRSASISSMLFYIILWSALVFILVLMLVSMTDFMLRSRQANIKTLYMLGAKRKYLFGICGTEMLTCGAASAILGVLLSLIVLAVYSSLVVTVSNIYITLIITAAILLSAASAVLIPYITAYDHFKKERYM